MTKDEALRKAIDSLVKFAKGESGGLPVTVLIEALQKALTQKTSNHSDNHWEHQVNMAYTEGYQEGRASAQKEAQTLTGGDDRRHIICLCPDCIKPQLEPVKLKPEDVVVEQYVIANSGFTLNKTGVRLTHKPTGKIVQVNEERSQHRNKAVAWEMLERLVASEPSKIDPIAVVTGTHAGYFVVRPTDPAMVLPVNMPLYTHPKEWQDLTDEQILAEVKRIDPDEQYLPKALAQLARAILAAAKEKNT